MLSEMFVDYQTFRNGYIDRIEEAIKNGYYDVLNHSLRVDYIRTSHHSRSAIYIKNLRKIFEPLLGGIWVTRLLSDLANVCKSHGEGLDSVRNLKKNVRYIGSEEINFNSYL